MKAAIYGAGAIGTVLGAYIARSGGDIHLISRNAEHIAALKERGATVAGKDSFTVPVKALLPEEMEEGYDVVFLACKQGDGGAALNAIKDKLAVGGVICTMQNGLPEKYVAEAVGADRCFGCVVSWGATFKGRGECELTTPLKSCRFDVGSPYGRETPHGIVELLGAMGRTEVREDFAGVRWSKLIINSAFSALSAVTGMTFGQLARDGSSRRIAQVMFNEGVNAARAAGIKPAKIQGADVARIFGYSNAFKKRLSYMLFPLMMKNHGALVSGMYFDLLRGRRSEIDWISGELVREAELHGAEVPVTARAVEVVHAVERGEFTVGRHCLKLIETK